MRAIKISLAALLAIVLAPASHAENPYQPALTLIAAGHPAEAYHQLRPKLLGSAGNPEFDTAFGLAALDNGAPAEAITAFERVLALDPANLPIRTELARAYAQLGDPAAAKRELDAVQNNPATPAPVRTNLSNYTNVLEEALSGGPRKINATINASTGYDSNINNATTSSYLVVPALAALGPARLASGAQAQGSAYSEVGATLTATQPITLSRSLFASLSANTKTPFESSDYTQTTLSGEGGIQFLTPDTGKFTLGLSAQKFWFGGEDYTDTLAASGNWQLLLGNNSNLTTYATVSHIEYQENDAQTANRAILGASLDTRWHTALSPYAFAGIYGGTEQTEDDTADYFSHNLIGLQSGVELFPAPNLSLFLDARYEIRDYADDYPLFMQARLDRQLDLTTGATYALTPNLALRPTLSYRHAASNIGFYEYQRWLANLNLRYTFQ